MVKRYITVTVSVILLFVMQSTLFKAWALANIAPNLLIIITSSVGFIRGKKEGMFTGVLSGLLIDLFYCDVIGINALIYMYVGYVNGIFKKNFLPEDVRMPLVLIGASDFIYSVLVFVCWFVIRGKFGFGYYFIHIMMPEMVYTVLISLVLYRIILFVNIKFDKFELRSKRKFV